MRLFAAVPLPEVALVQAAAILADLRERPWPVRWVRPEGLHITLKFFGDVVPERYDTIAEMMGFAISGTPALKLSLARAGAFPDLKRPRVGRLELAGDITGLVLLQDRLEQGGLQIGFPPEGRPFYPHITLGRVKEGQRLPGEAPAELEAVVGDAAFEADRVVLFESIQTEIGPKYDSRAELILGQ
jgi:2'-5' RNA ligase